MFCEWSYAVFAWKNSGIPVYNAPHRSSDVPVAEEGGLHTGIIEFLCVNAGHTQQNLCVRVTLELFVR